jgi:S-formylglutathione hydrolase FrmB
VRTVSRHRLVVLLALAILGGLVVRERLSPAVAAPSQTLYITWPSPSMGGSLPAAVYLPQNYDAGEARYPVVYFLHGLPAGPTAYKLNGYVAGAVAASSHAAIVVAPQGSRKSNDDRECGLGQVCTAVARAGAGVPRAAGVALADTRRA